MNPLFKQKVDVEVLPTNAPDETKLEKWEHTAIKHGLSGEWVVAARLGEPAYSEEQIEMIANLFGR